MKNKKNTETRPAATPEPMSTVGIDEVFPELIKDLESRRQLGIEKYGHPLQTHNGRDPLIDAYQERLDDVVYTKQFLMERDSRDSQFSLKNYLSKQKDWFLRVFGPGPRDAGLTAHIKGELNEIRDNPGDLEEWIDVLILGFEGALRTADNVDDVIAALQAKQDKNLSRAWPDWRDADIDKPIEHVKPFCKKCGSWHDPEKPCSI